MGAGYKQDCESRDCLKLSSVAARMQQRKVFLLAGTAPNINSVKSGLCPHGMSPGACPICSGMGGGGSKRVGERTQKAGEWSYHQCAMVGAMMKARAERLEMHENNLKLHAQAVLEFQQNLDKMTQKMVEFANRISNNFIFKPVAFIIKNIIVAGINNFKTLASTILNTISNISDKLSQLKQKFADIQDKLNAIFGEAKAFVEKKVSELVSAVKSKFEGLFKIFKKDNARDDDTKVDDDKKIFNLKKFIQKIREKKKDDTKDKSGS